MRTPRPSSADGKASPARLTCHRRTASTTAALTSAGESRSKHHSIPASSTTWLKPMTVQPMRAAVARKADAGPVTAAHGEAARASRARAAARSAAINALSRRPSHTASAQCRIGRTWAAKAGSVVWLAVSSAISNTKSGDFPAAAALQPRATSRRHCKSAVVATPTTWMPHDVAALTPVRKSRATPTAERRRRPSRDRRALRATNRL